MSDEEEENTCDYDYSLKIESVIRFVRYWGAGTVTRALDRVITVPVSVPRLKFLEKPYGLEEYTES